MQKLLAAIGLLGLLAVPVSADGWPQFRGVNATGLAQGSAPLPDAIGPNTNVIWKTELPAGHSSPVVTAARIYLTAERAGKLITVALDRNTGNILWQRDAPYDRLEEIHQIGSHAQSTPTADDERVVSFFGSAGLFCYDPAGDPLWHRPMGPFKNGFGAGSSPILAGDWVILNQDHDVESFLMALDKRTGKTVWRTDRSEFPRNYATPVIWESGGQKQIVVAASLRVVGYDFMTGKEVWTVRGISRIVNMTPVVGTDGRLYVAAWAPGGDETDRIHVDPFDALLDLHDKNANQTLELDELPPGPLVIRFNQIDRDKDDHVSRAEYDGMRRIFEEAQNVVLAVEPGGTGDITQTHVRWQARRHLPYVPSPLYHAGRLFMVKNGGIVACLDAETGTLLKAGRAKGNDQYYSSPVAGDGKIFLVSQRGELSVLRAGPDLDPISDARFEEDVYATPAIVDGRIFLRTSGHLYCFGLGTRLANETKR